MCELVIPIHALYLYLARKTLPPNDPGLFALGWVLDLPNSICKIYIIRSEEMMSYSSTPKVNQKPPSLYRTWVICCRYHNVYQTSFHGAKQPQWRAELRINRWPQQTENKREGPRQSNKNLENEMTKKMDLILKARRIGGNFSKSTDTDD